MLLTLGGRDGNLATGSELDKPDSERVNRSWGSITAGQTTSASVGQIAVNVATLSVVSHVDAIQNQVVSKSLADRIRSSNGAKLLVLVRGSGTLQSKLERRDSVSVTLVYENRLVKLAFGSGWIAGFEAT